MATRKTKGIATTAGRVKLRQKKLAYGTSLYLDTYSHGKRTYEFLQLYLTGDRQRDAEIIRVAEAKRSQRELEFAVEGTGIVPAHIKHESFLKYFEAIAMKKGHPAWRGAHNYLCAYAGDSLPFGHVTKAWIEGFRSYLLDESGLSQNTCALYWQKLKHALGRAVADRKLTSDPSGEVEPIRMRSTERHHLTIEEIRQLAVTPCRDEACRRAFLFSCYTGLRRSDLYALTWDRIQGDMLTVRIQKTDKVEYLPLSDTALQLLGPAATGKVFSLPAMRTADNTLLRWGAEAKIGKSLTWHVARHTYAMLLLRNGAGLYEVSKLLGHADIKTTTIYARMLDEQKREAVAKLPSL